MTSRYVVEFAGKKSHDIKKLNEAIGIYQKLKECFSDEPELYRLTGRHVERIKNLRVSIPPINSSLEGRIERDTVPQRQIQKDGVINVFDDDENGTIGLVLVEDHNYLFHITSFHGRPTRLPIEGEEVNVLLQTRNYSVDAVFAKKRILQ